MTFLTGVLSVLELPAGVVAFPVLDEVPEVGLLLGMVTVIVGCGVVDCSVSCCN
jgi:hypothetical protein